jgi:hypothetical protein
VRFFDFFRRCLATVHFTPKVDFIGEQAGPAEARGAPMNTEPVPTVDDRSIYGRIVLCGTCGHIHRVVTS